MLNNIFEALGGVHDKLLELDDTASDLRKINDSLLRDNKELLNRVKELEEENTRLKDRLSEK